MMSAWQAMAIEARERLVQRLAGSAPDHRPERTRLGAALLSQADPDLAPLLPPNPQPAAVLIGLIDAEGEPGILLTVRASHLRQHAGQIAFPGGRIEPHDSGPAEAALREAAEEVGLSREDATLVGFLPDQLVLTGFRITPVVARLDAGFSPRFDLTEVQGGFVLPWVHLLDEANHVENTRHIAGRDVRVRDIHYGDHRIWGATAGILLTLVEMSRP